MSITQQTHTVNQAFYQPIHGLAARSAQARTCPEFGDEAYVRCGVQRVFGGGLCTHHDPARFFSYRRDPVTGRMAALIWLDAE